jgi:hypothetical protein
MRFDEIKKGQKDANGYTRCWPGKHAEGTKKGKNGGQVRNCVPNEGVAEGLPQTLRKVVPGHAKREIDQKMDAGKFGKTDADKDANFQRYKKIQDKLKGQGVAEGTGNIGAQIKALYQKISNQGDDAIEFMYYDSPIFAQYWDEYEGDLDSMIAELNPRVLQVIYDELAAAAEDQDIDEGYNAEYDDEAGMADNNLETLERAVEGIDELINAGDNLPEWCQEKIAVSKSMLVTVWDYMKSEEDRGANPELAEEFDMIERIIESIAAQNGVDSDVVWTDLESLTEDELYAFAVTSQLNEDWSKVNKRDKTDGMSQKAVNAYRRENPGSKLKTAVTTKPSKLKKGSKASKRRKSYCSRSKGQMNMHNISCAKTPDKAICKARRRWNC